MTKIPVRTKHSKQGLLDMVNYISSIANTKEMTVVEIGSYTGISAVTFARNFKKVYTIDPWKQGIGGINNQVDMKKVFEIFKKATNIFSNIVIIKDFSYNVVSAFQDKTLDMIYIDGLHTYAAVNRDLQDWIPKVKIGGFITGHDFHRGKFPGVVRAVRELVGNGVRLFKDTSWLKQI